MIKSIFIAVLSATMVSVGNAECANACNGHGRCTSYDMCICNRNWQANDCSERICQYGLAHVDTPKGDLNMDGVISGPDEILVENSFAYPFGTTEQFPRMQNSDLADVANSAHYYMECSNKGTCNRATGECECFDGYDGAACQRASCPGYPNSCSGHGVCKTIKQLASADYDNIYELWDKDSTMGCECDAGFSGPDCSLRQCKYGVDPLYLDDTATIKYSVWNFAVMTTGPFANFSNGEYDHVADGGWWQIVFYDHHGEDWMTEPIPNNASCARVVEAINNMPNDVIPGTMTEDQCAMTFALNVDPLAATTNKFGTAPYSHRASFLINDPSDNVRPKIVTHMGFWLDGHEDSDVANAAYTLSGTLYRIHFNQNPGKLREPKINVYLDGKRPSLTSGRVGDTVITKVWTDGNQGEDADYFGDHCDGVTVTISSIVDVADPDHRVHVLGDLTSDEEKLMKYCLGESDFNSNNNVDVYDWDFGSDDYPHLIKLVLSTGTLSDGGHYAAIKYDGTHFVLMNPVLANMTTDLYEVYTTKGTFARASNMTSVAMDFASNKFYMTNFSDVVAFGDEDEVYDGDLSCETQLGIHFVTHCLNKSDVFTFLSTNSTVNPDRINLYTVEKLHHESYIEFDQRAHGINFGPRTHVITSDLSSNWAYGATGGEFIDANVKYYVYKFFPDHESTYTYVAQCSNRGLCNEAEGLCQCFGGYTSDDCSEQNSLSV